MSPDICRAEACDVLVCIQPTISDGRLAPVLAQQWGKGETGVMFEEPQFIWSWSGIVFWASPEEQTGEMISGNSLVGTHLMTATLRWGYHHMSLVTWPLQTAGSPGDHGLQQPQLGRGGHQSTEGAQCQLRQPLHPADQGDIIMWGGEEGRGWCDMWRWC